MWDILLAERLSDGREVMYGVAVDDAYNYHDLDSEHSNPFRGWVMVRKRAESLDAAAIVSAMESGDFYGSSGVVLDSIDVSDETLSLSIRAEADASYRTSFIGTKRGYDRETREVRIEEAEGGAPSVLYHYSDEIGEVPAVVEGGPTELRLFRRRDLRAGESSVFQAQEQPIPRG
jgi:hypothetical protein